MVSSFVDLLVHEVNDLFLIGIESHIISLSCPIRFVERPSSDMIAKIFIEADQDASVFLFLDPEQRRPLVCFFFVICGYSESDDLIRPSVRSGNRDQTDLDSLDLPVTDSDDIFAGRIGLRLVCRLRGLAIRFSRLVCRLGGLSCLGGSLGRIRSARLR